MWILGLKGIVQEEGLVIKSTLVVADTRAVLSWHPLAPWCLLLLLGNYSFFH